MNSASRKKKQPKFHDFPRHSELVSMYNCVVQTPHKDVRVVFTTLHLILEISLKKLARYYKIEVSTSSHRLTGLIYEVSRKDIVVDGWRRDLTNKGVLEYYQQFPYDELRFKASLPPDSYLPDYMEFQKFVIAILQRLQWIESQAR